RFLVGALLPAHPFHQIEDQIFDGVAHKWYRGRMTRLTCGGGREDNELRECRLSHCYQAQRLVRLTLFLWRPLQNIQTIAVGVSRLLPPDTPSNRVEIQHRRYSTECYGCLPRRGAVRVRANSAARRYCLRQRHTHYSA